MFSQKQTQLFAVNKKQPTSVTSTFVQAGLKKSAETLSENGALKYSTTGNAFIDQFGQISAYRQPRSFNDITKDCETLWAINPTLTVLFIFYIRMITRVVQLFNGSKTSVTQRGAEMRHEGIMRMIWLHFKSPDIFWKNIGLFVSVGSWKDIITMMKYDLVYHGWDNRKLDWEKFNNLILSGLANPNTSELIKKYLPQIKANSACTTVESQADNIIAKWLSSRIFGNKDSASTYKKYRKLKSSGTAHEWQQLISQQKFDRIDFDSIHGRALHLLVKGKFLKNQALTEKYAEWVGNPEKKEVKFTGFVSELFEPFDFKRYAGCKYKTLVMVPKHEQDTANKQFAELVKKGGESEQCNYIVVRDTSSSMTSDAVGMNMSSYSVAKSLALYFSEFLKGRFANSWIEFNSTAKMHTWKGTTPLEKWYNDNSSYVGSTNFQSVIDLFVTIKQQGVPESEFPTGILCISDMEFDPAELHKTNVQSALEKLKYAGFSAEYVNNFRIVLWNIPNRHYGDTRTKFETFGDVKNVFYLSGYSGSAIGFLTGNVQTAQDLFNEAMNQEVLQLIDA